MAALLALVLGCASSSAPSRRASPSDVVIAWRVSQGLWGAENVVVTGDGKVRQSFVPVQGGSQPERHEQTAATPEELAAIERAAIDNDFCEIESGRLGVPDEAKPTLEIRLGEIDCAITLWDGEWRDDEDAAAVIAALAPVLRRVHASLP